MTVNRNGCNFYTDLYVKPMDTNHLLHFDSCHPKVWINPSKMVSYYTVKGNVNEEGKMDSRLDEMIHKFKERDYPNNLISTHTESQLLSASLKPDCISTSNPFSLKIVNIIWKYK